MRYFFDKIRQVLKNLLLLDPFGLGSWGICLLTLALLSIASTIKLYESAQKFIAIKSQFQYLVFMTMMAIQTILLILFYQRTRKGVSRGGPGPPNRNVVQNRAEIFYFQVRS